MSARIAWRLYDPVLDTEYLMPVNPYSDDGSHAIINGVGYQSASGFYEDSLGNAQVGTIVFGTPGELETFRYSGKVYNILDYSNLEAWTMKDYSVYLTDDLGRIFEIIIDRFETRRLRTSTLYPYKHEYTLSGFVLGEVESIPGVE